MSVHAVTDPSVVLDRPRRRPKPGMSDTPTARAAGLEASGDRSVVVTGDDVHVVQILAEAWRPITEVDAPAGIDNVPLLPGVRRT